MSLNYKISDHDIDHFNACKRESCTLCNSARRTICIRIRHERDRLKNISRSDFIQENTQWPEKSQEREPKTIP
jgi:hypothetical protein